MAEAQPSQVKIPEDKYIEVLQLKLAEARQKNDQQEAVILALLSDVEQLTAERDEYAESLRQAWTDRENEEKKDEPSTDSG